MARERNVPEQLVIGAITIDFAVIIYTLLLLIGFSHRDFKCELLSRALDLGFRSHHVLHKIILATTMSAAVLGWFAAITISIHAYRVLKRRSVADINSYSNKTPFLAFLTALLLAITLYLHGNFRSSPCMILNVISIVFLNIGAYFLLRYFD